MEKTMMQELSGPHVHVRDLKYVSDTLQHIVEGGKDRLQVIVDFDRTLTKFKNDGKINKTTFGALDDSEHLPVLYKEEALKLRGHYYAIEVDGQLTVEQKYPYMVEWWTKAHDLLIKCMLNRDIIKKSVHDAAIVLRDGYEWLFQSLHDHGIPLLIFSAGIGDVIDEILKEQGPVYNNMKVVSNFIDFDNKGNMVGFKGALIHIYNKNEAAIHDSHYFNDIAHRDNIILMGDSLGDLQMAKGAVTAKNTLKIGFLNDRVDELLEQFMDSYDIVLVSDETLNVPNAVLSKVLKCARN